MYSMPLNWTVGEDMTWKVDEDGAVTFSPQETRYNVDQYYLNWSLNLVDEFEGR